MSVIDSVAETPEGTLLSKVWQQRDYVMTFATEISIFLSQILLYRWIALGMNKQSFSEFALARRSVTLIQPLLLLGLTVALPRHLSFASAKGDEARCQRLYGSAISTVFVTTIVAVTVSNTFAGTIAHFLFGSAVYSNLLVSLTFMLGGIGIHSLACSYFRGLLQMATANSLQFINLGIVPVLMFALFPKSVPSLLLRIGFCWIMVSAFFLSKTPIRAFGFHKRELRDLFSYGLQRVPGDFMLMSLLTFPATFLAHVVGIQSAGAMAFGISFLTMFGAIFGPASLVLLPKTSRMIATGEASELRSHIRTAIALTLLIALGLTAAAELFGDVIIRLYLGPGYGDVSFYLRILATASVPYALYCVLRGLIDAYYEVGINSFNLFIAFLVFSVLAAIGVVVHSSTAVPFALVTGLYVLCGLTVFRVWLIVGGKDSCLSR